MDLHDAINSKLGEVNCVQLVRGTDVEVFSYLSEHYRWVTKRNGQVRNLQQFELVHLICGITHETRKKGSMLVVTEIDPAVRAE